MKMSRFIHIMRLWLPSRHVLRSPTTTANRWQNLQFQVTAEIREKNQDLNSLSSYWNSLKENFEARDVSSKPTWHGDLKRPWQLKPHWHFKYIAHLGKGETLSAVKLTYWLLLAFSRQLAKLGKKFRKWLETFPKK